MDVALGVAQLIAAALLIALVYSAVRQSQPTLIGVLILAGIVAFGVFVIRRSDRRTHSDAMRFLPVSMPSESTIRQPEVQPQTTAAHIDQLRAIDWFQFEKLVGLLYRKQGYTVTRLGGANPDGGIDLVIEKDGQRSAVQCKQWRTWNVGVKAVREFLGALTDSGIQKGVFITLCGYTGEAKQLARKHGIDIIHEKGLARMLALTDARFDPEALAILRDTRKFCPKCESEMVLRKAATGAGAGKQFWGCSTYPRCRFTMPAYGR
jgi:hypothetical protein